MVSARSGLVKLWIKGYNEERQKTQNASTPFGVRLARRFGVQEHDFCEDLPSGARDFIRGMMAERWDMTWEGEDPAFPENVCHAHASAFENNIKQAHTNVSVVDMHATFQKVTATCGRNVAESFAEDFNNHSAKNRVYVPDGNVHRGCKYITHVDTIYIDDFETALAVMENKLFYGVITGKTTAKALQAVTCTGSRLGKLVGEDPSSGGRVSIFEQDFVNLVVPVVGISEAFGSRGERVTPDVCKKAMEVLAEMASAVGTTSLLVSRHRPARSQCAAVVARQCRPARQTRKIVGTPTKKSSAVVHKSSQRFAIGCLQRGVHATKALFAPAKGGVVELVDCSWDA